MKVVRIRTFTAVFLADMTPRNPRTGCDDPPIARTSETVAMIDRGVAQTVKVKVFKVPKAPYRVEAPMKRIALLLVLVPLAACNCDGKLAAGSPCDDAQQCAAGLVCNPADGTCAEVDECDLDALDGFNTFVNSVQVKKRLRRMLSAFAIARIDHRDI